MTKHPSRDSVRLSQVLRMTGMAMTFLYMLFLIGGEASRSFAATDSETAIVRLTVDSGIGFSCDADGNNSRGSGETLSIGTITFNGDTGVYSDNRAVKCRVVTNNVTGYTVGWRIFTGSGGVSTGHLISQFENVIQAFGTGNTSNYTKTWELNPSANQNDSRWGGRVSSTSSGSDVAPMLYFPRAVEYAQRSLAADTSASCTSFFVSIKKSEKCVLRHLGKRASVVAHHSELVSGRKRTTVVTARAFWTLHCDNRHKILLSVKAQIGQNRTFHAI